LLTAIPVAALAAGSLLVYRGVDASGREPHAQPLPSHVFAIQPAAARALPQPRALAKPQHGSVQTSCRPVTDGEPQVAIPSLCLFAPLVATRVVNDSLLIPQDVRLVGLDTDSAALTAPAGTTIVAGHVDAYDQGAGVFYFLHRVRPGARIAVTGVDGSRTSWRVYRVAVARKSALPGDIWTRSGPRRLVLVTCGGPILHLASGNTYEDNVLVYATPATR
jgi:hypothetical protein